VVDCQWACPAQTDVPEYIRLIGQGRYADAYLLNRATNVFPGILGRTCDRPCEPACRRGRVDGEPVAICRLKRVASDLRKDVSSRLPKGALRRNGKRVATVGCGPASLTVANDLLPLGYEVTIFERAEAAGGLMRSSIPAFRLPADVLDTETSAVLSMGADVRYGVEVTSMAALLEEGYDAVFVGSGAPKGNDLEIPGRHDGDADEHVHVSLDWLASIAFGHVTSVGERVLVIGVGNTAMDCCRTARRLGGTEVRVVARRPRAFFKASPWELQDAIDEGVEILTERAPRRFVTAHGRLVGVEFDVLEWDERAERSTVLRTEFLPADDVVLAIGQENAFPWIERDLGIEFGRWDVPIVDPVTMSSTRAGVFIGGDAAFGPKNIVWAVAHGHEAAISIDRHCQDLPVGDRPPVRAALVSQKMSIGEWSYANDFNPVGRQEPPHVELARRFAELAVEVELDFTPAQVAREIQRCLNCDIQTQFSASRCIECDACIDICPVDCLQIVAGDGGAASTSADGASDLGARSGRSDEPVFISLPLPQTGRFMVKDEDLCVHCGLCAERCPTAAWDMAKLEVFLPAAGLADVATPR
jgi:NADPH-dependent glutamate synthase beta subunit-like oxidoreductase/ferredoxin